MTSRPVVFATVAGVVHILEPTRSGDTSRNVATVHRLSILAFPTAAVPNGR